MGGLRLVSLVGGLVHDGLDDRLDDIVTLVLLGDRLERGVLVLLGLVRLLVRLLGRLRVTRRR